MPSFSRSQLSHYFEPLMLLMGIVGPMATIPQLYKLYFSHSQHAAGLSLSTWIMYSGLSFLWILYGLLHRNAPIWVGNGLNFGMNSAMAFGIYWQVGMTF